MENSIAELLKGSRKRDPRSLIRKFHQNLRNFQWSSDEVQNILKHSHELVCSGAGTIQNLILGCSMLDILFTRIAREEVLRNGEDLVRSKDLLSEIITNVCKGISNAHTVSSDEVPNGQDEDGHPTPRMAKLCTIECITAMLACIAVHVGLKSMITPISRSQIVKTCMNCLEYGDSDHNGWIAILQLSGVAIQVFRKETSHLSDTVRKARLKAVGHNPKLDAALLNVLGIVSAGALTKDAGKPSTLFENGAGLYGTIIGSIVGESLTSEVVFDEWNLTVPISPVRTRKDAVSLIEALERVRSYITVVLKHNPMSGTISVQPIVKTALDAITFRVSQENVVSDAQKLVCEKMQCSALQILKSLVEVLGHDFSPMISQVVVPVTRLLQSSVESNRNPAIVDKCYRFLSSSVSTYGGIFSDAVADVIISSTTQVLLLNMEGTSVEQSESPGKRRKLDTRATRVDVRGGSTPLEFMAQLSLLEFLKVFIGYESREKFVRSQRSLVTLVAASTVADLNAVQIARDVQVETTIAKMQVLKTALAEIGHVDALSALFAVKQCRSPILRRQATALLAVVRESAPVRLPPWHFNPNRFDPFRDLTQTIMAKQTGDTADVVDDEGEQEEIAVRGHASPAHASEDAVEADSAERKVRRQAQTGLQREAPMLSEPVQPAPQSKFHEKILNPVAAQSEANQLGPLVSETNDVDDAVRAPVSPVQDASDSDSEELPEFNDLAPPDED
eukprot:Clim_evm2s242 gene=Clim_evmTU2s242